MAPCQATPAPRRARRSTSRASTAPMEASAASTTTRRRNTTWPATRSPNTDDAHLEHSRAGSRSGGAKALTGRCAEPASDRDHARLEADLRPRVGGHPQRLTASTRHSGHSVTWSGAGTPPAQLRYRGWRAENAPATRSEAARQSPRHPHQPDSRNPSGPSDTTADGTGRRASHTRPTYVPQRSRPHSPTAIRPAQHGCAARDSNPEPAD